MKKLYVYLFGNETSWGIIPYAMIRFRFRFFDLLEYEARIFADWAYQKKQGY